MKLLPLPQHLGQRVSQYVRPFLILFFQVIFFGLIFSPATLASDEKAVVEDTMLALEKKYSKKSFSTDFTQVSKLTALDITETASGKAFFSHPGKMRWEYKEPAQHEIITNGKSLWIYRPDENQVMTGDASRFFSSGGGGAFLSNISLVRENYSIHLKALTSAYIEMTLTAKKPTPEIASIDIRISQKTGEIMQVTTYNQFNDTTQFEFSNIQFEKISPDIFEFTIPEGVHTIGLE